MVKKNYFWGGASFRWVYPHENRLAMYLGVCQDRESVNKNPGCHVEFFEN